MSNTIQNTLIALQQLITNTEDYDDDFLPPTKEVIEYTSNLVKETAFVYSGPWIVYCCVPLGDEDLILQWGTINRNVALYVPVKTELAVVATYEHSNQEKSPGLYGRASAALLAEAMQWLLNSPS